MDRKQSVWNISQPGDTASIDYFNLARILATCRKCPKTIVYVVSETSFHNGEVTRWQGEIYDNLERLYIDTDEENATLKEAANCDSFYNDVYHTFQLNKAFRPYLLRRQLLNIVKKGVYESIFGPSTISASQIVESPLVGYYDRHGTVNRASYLRSITKGDLFRYYLKDYKIGKANDLFFKKFIATARAKHINLFVVQMPVSSIYYEEAGKIQDKFHGYITPLLKELQLNAFDDRDYFKTLTQFSDLYHLNVDGAKVYSNHLAQEINKVVSMAAITKWNGDKGLMRHSGGVSLGKYRGRMDVVYIGKKPLDERWWAKR